MTTNTTLIFQLPYPDGNELVTQGDDAIAALATAIELALNPPWVGLTSVLKAGFAPAAGYQAPAYRVFDDGRVQMRGGISRGSNYSSGLVLLTLPAEARPLSATVSVPIATSRTGTAGPVVGRMDIVPSGDATIYVDNTVVSNWLALDGAAFSR